MSRTTKLPVRPFLTRLRLFQGQAAHIGAHLLATITWIIPDMWRQKRPVKDTLADNANCDTRPTPVRNLAGMGQDRLAQLRLARFQQGDLAANIGKLVCKRKGMHGGLNFGLSGPAFAIPLNFL